MRKSLKHLPPQKQREIEGIVMRILQNISDVEMIILFGSHTGDNWVQDYYVKDHITYSYISDYDILVIVKSNRTLYKHELWNKLREGIDSLQLKSPAMIITHNIDYVNQKLRDAQYFFSDIKREGILLYDSGKSKLERLRKLPASEDRKRIATDYFKQWSKSAKEFYEVFKISFEKKWYNKAAFFLHQATEAAYAELLLVYTNYKPKTHDIIKLTALATNYDTRFFEIFPTVDPKQEECFDLLNRAYVEARYEKDYKISKKQLEYLAERIRKLQRLVNKNCKAKIESF